MNFRVIAFCLVSLLPTLAAAPARGTWEEVQSLHRGQKIRVLTKAKESFKGTFQTLTVDSLVLADGSSERSIPRADVGKVDAETQARVRNALIGAGVGLAIGVVVDQTLGTRTRNETGENAGVRAATIIVPAAAIGGLSALIPSYRTVYRAPK